MRQRAAVHATPPRSADNDNGYPQWEEDDKKKKPARQRNSYQLSLGDLIQEPSAVSKRDLYRHNSGDGLVSRTIETSSPIPGSSEGAARRRKHVSVHPKDDNNQRMHSPQHHFTEINYNSYDNVQYQHQGEPHHSSGSLPPYTHPHSQRDINHAASQAFYQQYGSNYAAHHHIDNRPELFQQHSLPQSNAHKLSFQHFERTFHLDPNPLAAVHFRRTLHVPDNQYRAFLAGGKRRDVPPTIHPVCCANVCAGFSFVGFIFFIFIGILMDTQPLFIAGSLPTALKENDNGKTTTIYFVTAERLPMATNAYHASYAYILTMFACLIFVHFERFNSAIKRRSYQDVPDAEGSTVGVVGDGSLPNFHDGETHTSPAYQLSPWNRFVSTASKSTVKLREWAVTTTAGAWAGRGKRTTRKKACAKTI